MRKWTIEDSAELYNVKGWGLNYVGINNQGNLFVKPNSGSPEIDIKEIIDELNLTDVNTPVLLRFPDILDSRIETLAECFAKSSEEYEYKGNYFTVYPIKVNQTKQVVEEILRYGKKYNIGLEAGSKPELHAVLSFTENSDALIVCNGYKDDDFIELALLAQKMGRKVYIVVEKLNELRLIIKKSKQLNVAPNIGIRVKLSSEGSGKWEDSGGDRSKFGLNASELLEAIAMAEKAKVLDRIKLVHFHLGSQITNIRNIKNALREASQFYVQLCKMNCSVEFVDIGGGLGVDYDGSKSSGSSSMNYYIQEYSNDAVATFGEACEKHGLKHPNIISESGRSLTAHHTLLVFDVLEKTTLPSWPEDEETTDNDHELTKELYDIWDNFTLQGMLESWHDALQIRGEAYDLFSLGLLDLSTRAKIERLFWSIAREVYHASQEMKHPPPELRKLSKMLADKYFCNFSLFQSLPDSWAIDQVFPIMPIHRLNEKPNRVATLQDITCDSDGKIDNFIGARDIAYYLPVHDFKKGKPYYIGVMLIGAYQEILGDMHNLFGDTNTVHIKIKDNDYVIDQVIDGQTVTEVLEYVQYNSKKMVRTMETWVSRAVKEGRITAVEGKEFLSNYKSGLYGYTYLE